MSVLVEGMVMPYGCADCSFMRGAVYDAKGRASYFCEASVAGICGKNVTDDVIAMYEGDEGYRPDFCPLKEVEADTGPHWIPVTERLPEEEDSIFARYYGTDRWRKSMFRKKSREVIVTSVFEDGELHTEVAHTTDSEWHVGVNVVPRTVIAWMPMPEPYKGVTE